MQTQSYDLVVIGGGPVGICGANAAAIFGKRIALVEKLPEVGRAGINTGTIPSKTLRETASRFPDGGRASSSASTFHSGAEPRSPISCS
jgi:pyruvate/2-oxoglutarate dehydrogenase complex dihydrolipoamide dehydrogenase (E3) component